MCTTVAVYSQHSRSHTVLCMWVWEQRIHIWESVQDEKKQERQKCPAGTRQKGSKNWGLVWRNRKKISQIIKDYFHLPFFLLIILWGDRTELVSSVFSSLCPISVTINISAMVWLHCSPVAVGRGGGIISIPVVITTCLCWLLEDGEGRGDGTRYSLHNWGSEWLQGRVPALARCGNFIIFLFLLLFVSLGSFLEVRLFYFHYISRYHNYLK